MKVLIIGGGGREHALAWKVAQSPRVTRIYCAPGNGGMTGVAECVPVMAEDTNALVEFARQNAIDLTLVGPEAPLVAGVVDAFLQAGLSIFGPTARAAALEGSKAMAKELMAKYNIPTARYAVFDSPDQARRHIEKTGAPCVVKADGLAAGKGVVVAMDEATAFQAVEEIMEKRVFGAAGAQVVVEEFMEGEEVSLLALTDGERVVPLLPAQDHKRVFNDDQGPNTGGMGAYCPAPVYTAELHQLTMEQILLPTVRGMAREGRPYRGMLYAGLMITKDGPKVLEYNARFGDPETQPLMMMLQSDLVDAVEGVLSGRLDPSMVQWYPGAAVCVVMAAGGYPGPYTKGLPITGLDLVPPEVAVFHAGTAIANGQVVTAGGRVLGVTARGHDIASAIEAAYRGVKAISFQGAHYRTDIGHRALTR